MVGCSVPESAAGDGGRGRGEDAAVAAQQLNGGNLSLYYSLIYKKHKCTNIILYLLHFGYFQHSESYISIPNILLKIHTLIKYRYSILEKGYENPIIDIRRIFKEVWCAGWCPGGRGGPGRCLPGERGSQGGAGQAGRKGGRLFTVGTLTLN